MELEHKSNPIKIIIIIVLSVLFIAGFSYLGIQFAKNYQVKQRGKKKELSQAQNTIPWVEQQEEINMENTQTEEKENEEIIETLLPVYSEEAKNKMKNIYQSDEKIVYLTFDDGPSQAVTPLILDLLKKENIKATFFVLGSCVKQNPELLQREYNEGHYIANHGYSHQYSKLYAKANNVLEEFYKTEKEIQKALNNEHYSSHLFRFPGGYYGGRYAKIKKEAGHLLNENNISFIDWNCLTGDAEGANTKEKIMSNIKRYSQEKTTIVLLMHDAAAKILTYETLPQVIDYYRKQGYVFDNFYSIMK